jgi:hypothetical protein
MATNLRPQNGGVNYIHDESLAWTMAEAGNEDRTNSANYRDAVRFALAHLGLSADSVIVDEFMEHPALIHHSAWVTKGSEPRYSDYRNEKAQVLLQSNVSGSRDYFERRAKEFDEIAERKENWAQILYENPISEKYEAEHPDVDFQPDNLVKLEDLHGYQVDWISKLEEDNQNRNIALKMISGTLAQDMRLQYSFDELVSGSEDKDELIKKWQSMLSDDKATLGQIRQFYDEQFENYVLSPLREKANATGAILEDVRTGSASNIPNRV